MKLYHSIELHWADTRAILIEWSSGKAGNKTTAPIIPGTSFVGCTEEIKPDRITAASGIPAICWRDEEDHLFEQMQLRENTDYYVDVTVPVSLEEALNRASTGEWWPFTERLSGVFKRAPHRYWKEKDGKTTLVGRLNFGSHVGIADLTIVGGRRFLAEVVCTKLGYFEDYRELLRDISDKVSTLLMQVDTATAVRFRQSPSVNDEPLVYLFHLRRLMAPGSLPLAVESVLRNPHRLLKRQSELVSPELLRNPSPKAFLNNYPRLDFSRGGPLERLFRGFSPRQVPEEAENETPDTPENRYVLEFLQGLLHMIERLRKRLRERGYSASLRETESWSEQVAEWLSRPSWRDVGRFTHFPSNSQILQRRLGYRAILEADFRLQVGLRLPWDRGLQLSTATDGDVRPIYELYEYWCFFTLRETLRSICGNEDSSSNTLVTTKRDGLEIQLQKGKQASLTFTPKVGSGSCKVHLFYNKKFSRAPSPSEDWNGSYTAVFYPDCSILVETPNRKHWLHFDAKYRLDFKLWEQFTSKTPVTVENEIETDTFRLDQEEDVNVYKLGDLYKMHTYRDALLGSRGAYVLYPGPSGTEELFLRAPSLGFEPSTAKLPSVGAFPLRPGGEAGLKRIKEFLATALTVLATNGEMYQEETGLLINSTIKSVETIEDN